jgi:hypothetical protein
VAPQLMVHTTIYWKTLSTLGPRGVALWPEPTSLGWTATATTGIIQGIGQSAGNQTL